MVQYVLITTFRLCSICERGCCLFHCLYQPGKNVLQRKWEKTGGNVLQWKWEKKAGGNVLQWKWKENRWKCFTMKMGRKKQVGMFTMKMDFSSRTGSVAWASLTSPWEIALPGWHTGQHLFSFNTNKLSWKPGWCRRPRATWATAWGRGCPVPRASLAPMDIHHAIVSNFCQLLSSILIHHQHHPPQQ